jgi:hypothetical protein
MFQLKAEDRLRAWRDFRTTLDTLQLENAMAQIAEFWAQAPFSPYHLDPESIDQWPDPWTLIDENVYCDIAKCLGIVYTAILTQHRTDLSAEIRVYEDPRTGYEFNLAFFDQGKYILNMIDRSVVNITQIEKTLKFKKTITAVELQLEKY